MLPLQHNRREVIDQLLRGGGELRVSKSSFEDLLIVISPGERYKAYISNDSHEHYIIIGNIRVIKDTSLKPVSYIVERDI